jgi:hypothetical protein
MRPVGYTNVSISLFGVAAFLTGIALVVCLILLRDWRHDRAFDDAPQVEGTIAGLTDHCWRTKSGRTCRKVPLVSYRRSQEHGGERATFAADTYPRSKRDRIQLSSLVGMTVTVRYHVADDLDSSSAAIVANWPTARLSLAIWSGLALAGAGIAVIVALMLTPISTIWLILKEAISNGWARATN